jgi:hypothetical protein
VLATNSFDASTNFVLVSCNKKYRFDCATTGFARGIFRAVRLQCRNLKSKVNKHREREIKLTDVVTGPSKSKHNGWQITAVKNTSANTSALMAPVECGVGLLLANNEFVFLSRSMWQGPLLLILLRRVTDKMMVLIYKFWVWSFQNRWKWVVVVEAEGKVLFCNKLR